ncbi:MAG TPA: hypothetical protein ENK47_09200 [Euryarchaeota archaeon]|nr:hypothetical protein [Euryarchaeota archaeon]
MQNFEIASKIRELRDRISELREEEEILALKIENKFNEMEAVKKRRDELNDKVRELSRKPKDILQKRKEMWENIENMTTEKKNLFREMQPYLRRIGELRKLRDSYNEASRGTLERLKENLKETEKNLLKDDLSLKNELYLYNYLFELRDRLLVKARADAVHREIVRIKEEELSRFNKILSEFDTGIDDLKSNSHEGLMTAKEMWARRDEIREKAQKEHQAFIDGMKIVSDLKKKRWKIKREMTALYRQIDEWKKEFKKSPKERMSSDRDRKLKEALIKYKKGDKLSLEELSILVESGKMQ